MAWSVAARTAQRVVADPVHDRGAKEFHCADERLQAVHFQPFGVLTSWWPPSATGLAGRTVAGCRLGLASLFAASASLRDLDLTGHEDESRWPGVLAMTPAMPIHFATAAISLVSRFTAAL